MSDTLFGLGDELPHSGKHLGYVKIPYSSNKSAYGFIPVPLAIVGGVMGPTVLLLAGVFGDEPDAQIALLKLVQMLDPEVMCGRVIVMPMANAPASRIGVRHSPIDGKSLNKAFPGSAFGDPTSVIADYIERHLMPMSDIVIDLHSDSRSIKYVPSTTIVSHPNDDVMLKRLAVANAFRAPHTLVFKVFDERSTSGASLRSGTVRIATEMGGPRPVTNTLLGIQRVLGWSGIIDAHDDCEFKSEVLVVEHDHNFVYAMRDGLFESVCELGQNVIKGSPAGHIYNSPVSFSPSHTASVETDGKIICVRSNGITSAGDCLMHIGTEPSERMLAMCLEAPEARWLSIQRSRLKRRQRASLGSE